MELKPIQPESLVSVDDLARILEGNRTRLRALLSLILNICGMLLSASFVVLFFILQGRRPGLIRAIPALLFATVLSLALAMLFCVLSAYLRHSTAVVTRLQMIDEAMSLYNRERRRAVVAVAFLFLGIALFSIALAAFGYLQQR